MSKQKTHSFAVAAVVILTAIMLYDVMGAIVKHLRQDYPTAQLSMFRNIFGLLPTAAILFLSKTWVESGRRVVIRQWKFALIRGGFGALAQICLYLSLLHLEFATATSLLFAGPLFVTALSVPILGDRVGPWRWVAVTIGFIGILLVIQPAKESFTWYSALPLCAAFGFATISVTSRLFDKEVPTALLNLYHTLGSLVGSLIMIFLTEGFVPIASLEDWGWLIAMGFAGGLAAFCIVTAYRLAEPSSLSPFEYFAIPFSFSLGWIFFGEAPFERLIPGVFLIVGGGVLIAWRKRLESRSN